MKHTGDENTLTYHVEVAFLIQCQILITYCKEMCSSKERELTLKSWELKGLHA